MTAPTKLWIAERVKRQRQKACPHEVAQYIPDVGKWLCMDCGLLKKNLDRAEHGKKTK